MWDYSFRWSYSGINLSLDGTGGPECISYLSPWQRLWETVVICLISIGYLVWCWPRLRLPFDKSYVAEEGCWRRILLFSHAIIFGIELGFKFATNSLIWVLNPCHVVTVLQLFLLIVHPTPFTTAIFRMHIHMLNGPLLAMIFPVVNTRLLQFEQLVYYVQHILILAIPLFMLRNTTVFSVEPISEFSWVLLSLSTQTLYHFIVLQGVGLSTGINLDHMLCPAISDPFRGPHYRKWAVLHQSTLIPLLGKSVTFLILKLTNQMTPAGGKSNTRDAETPLASHWWQLFTNQTQGKSAIAVEADCTRSNGIVVAKED